MQSPSFRVPTLRAPLATLCAALLLALTVVTLSPAATGTASAAACTCKPKQGTLLSRADVLVTGTIAGVDDSETPAPFDLKVTRIYRGAEWIDTDTLSFVQDPDCPVSDLTAGGTWIVGARRTTPAAPGSAATMSPQSTQPSGTMTPSGTATGTTVTPQGTTSSSTGSADSSAPVSTPADTAGDAQASSTATGTADSSDAVLVAIGCTLTGPQTAAKLARIEARYGTGTAPTRPKPAAPVLTKVETAGPERFTRLAAPGAAMFVIGLLGFFGIRRLGRPKHS